MLGLGTYKVLDKGELSTGVEHTKLYLIHEGTDEKDTAAGAAQQVVGSEWVGKGGWVEPGALVGDADDERFGCRFKGCGDALARTVGVAVKYSIACCSGGCHRDAEDLVIIKSGL